MARGLARAKENEEESRIDLGEGSEMVYYPRFLDPCKADEWLHTLDTTIPWTRPTLTIFGRPCRQPRDTCYIANDGLPPYKYSNYKPVIHRWDDFPAVKSILDAVHKALPDCRFNSVLLNRYANGIDYVAWHSDDESVYGPTPTIASVTLGVEREFLIRKKTKKRTWQQGTCPESNFPISSNISIQSANASMVGDGPAQNPVSESLHSVVLKHGSLLVMTGFAQRDWQHSVPRRKKVYRVSSFHTRFKGEHVEDLEGILFQNILVFQSVSN